MKKKKNAVIKTKGMQELWEIHAYSGSVKNNDLKYLGSSTVWCYKETDEVLDLVRAALTVIDVALRNRQAKSDTRNALAAGTSDTAALKAMKSADPSTYNDVIELAKQVASGGKVDPALLERITKKAEAAKK